jgi:exopolysaccharide biosynthesis protein
MKPTSIVTALAAAFFITSLAFAEVKLPEHPYPGTTYEYVHRDDGPQTIFIVKVDLTDPRVNVRVAPGGADPDGPGEWQTTLQPASAIAKREGFDVTVNASFFEAKNTKDAEGAASGYVKDKWAKSVGWGMTDGKLWSPDVNKDWPAVWVEGDRAVRIGSPKNLPPNARQAVQGNGYVVRDGKLADPIGNLKVRHPRTVVGVDRDGKTLVLLTVDGRNPGKAIGMTGEELGREMLRLGCHTAINLDGGGSTTLVVRDPADGALKIVNDPSDHRERAVADVIGVTIEGDKPTTKPARD